MTASIIAIDPGASGGIAWTDRETGGADAAPMPDGMTAQIDFLRALVAEARPGLAVVERVGTFVPGDSPVAAARFARHCGWLEATLYALGVPVRQVPPATWMRGVFGASLPKDKAARKRAIKEEVQRRFPALPITLKTADALGLLEYARMRGGNLQ